MGLTNSLALVAAANAALPIAKSVLGPLAAMSADFSANVVGENTTVQVPLIATGAVDTTANSYETHASPTITVKTVTIDKKQFLDFPLTGLDEKTLQNVNYLTSLIGQMFYAVGAAAVADILSLVTNTNYSTHAWAGAAGDFDIDAVVDMRSACKTFPPNARCLVLPSEYTGAIMKDSKYTSSEASLGMINAFTGGKLPQIRGFNVAECDVIPTNSENLIGFACHPSAIAVAMRPALYQLQNEASVADFQIATDPETGISFGIYTHINPSTRISWISTEIHYGYAKGSALLKRILSVAP